MDSYIFVDGEFNETKIGELRWKVKEIVLISIQSSYDFQDFLILCNILEFKIDINPFKLINLNNSISASN